jgi:hypothetical protein
MEMDLEKARTDEDGVRFISTVEMGTMHLGGEGMKKRGRYRSARGREWESEVEM